MCSWPTNSSSVCGRIRRASGATSGSRAEAASEKRSPISPEVCSAPVATETHEDFSEPVLPGAGASDFERAAGHVRAGEVAPALRLLGRAALCLDYITRQLDMLEQMSPWEYQEIRRVLGHGSGFDSPGFREVRRVTPLLGEAFDGAVAAAGLDVVELYVQGRDREELTQRAKDEEAAESEVPGHGV